MSLMINVPDEGWPPPWPLVEELSAALPDDWILVGGLMVQLHVRLAGLPLARTTDDIDLLVDVAADRPALSRIARSLTQMGFSLHEPGWRGSPAHRMIRQGDVVDLLVADHLPSHVTPRLGGNRAMSIDGGAQALSRRLDVIISRHGHQTSISIPDLLGALVLKSAAVVADNRDTLRHLKDAALLAAAITDHLAVRSELHGSDRRRLLRLAELLSDPYHPAWIGLPDELRVRGQDTLRILTTERWQMQ